jgi:hypothetical protein
MQSIERRNDKWVRVTDEPNGEKSGAAQPENAGLKSQNQQKIPSSLPDITD